MHLEYDPTLNLNRERRGSASGDVWDAVYARLVVRNEPKRRAAERVEVVVTKVETIDLRAEFSDGPAAYRNEAHNLGPLQWTHTDRVELTVGAGASRTVDLGFVENLGGRWWFEVDMPSHPFSGIQHLWPGEHRLLLTVAGGNFDAKRYELTLEYDGLWTGEPEINEHLKISAPHELA